MLLGPWRNRLERQYPVPTDGTTISGITRMLLVGFIRVIRVIRVIEVQFVDLRLTYKPRPFSTPSPPAHPRRAVPPRVLSSPTTRQRPRGSPAPARARGA